MTSLAHRQRLPCPVAAAFVSTWESGLGDNDRRRILVPLRARLATTRLATGTAVVKSAAAADWLVHTCAPVWLEIARPDPAALSALRTCPPLYLDGDSRKGRIAVERAMQSVVNARMLACNAAWARSQSPDGQHQIEGEAIAAELLPIVSLTVLGRTGFDAALAAADRAPFTNRWGLLRGHLAGLAQAAVSTLAWEAVWSSAGVAPNGHAAWLQAAQRRLEREASALAAQLQPDAVLLGQRIVAP